MHSGLNKSDHIYWSLKAKVIAYEFSQGKRIYIGPIAEHFGVSTTPVRESLNRLAAEGLVLKAKRKGFVALTLRKNHVRKQYESTRQLLSDELGRLSLAMRKKMPGFEPVAALSARVNRRPRTDVGALAGLTAEVFASIGAFANKPHVDLSIGRANDHLYYIRTLECQRLEHVQSELACFCELFLAGECRELVAAVGDYHARRLKLLPELFPDKE